MENFFITCGFTVICIVGTLIFITISKIKEDIEIEKSDKIINSVIKEKTENEKAKTKLHTDNAGDNFNNSIEQLQKLSKERDKS